MEKKSNFVGNTGISEILELRNVFVKCMNPDHPEGLLPKAQDQGRKYFPLKERKITLESIKVYRFHVRTMHTLLRQAVHDIIHIMS